MEFRDLVVRALELVGMPNVSDFFPALRFLDLQRFRKENEMVWSRIIEIIGRLVDARQISSADSKLENNEDVLDSLLGENEYDLSTDDIKHLFADLFVAGTDTPAGTIEWAMTELICNPDKMVKAQSEIHSLVSSKEIIRDSDIPNLPYLQAVVKETLRLHPPAPFLVPHVAVEDAQIETFTVPKGTQVLVNVWSMGRDSKIWEEPERFEPERFLELELDYKGRNFEFIPFGAGRRICPGMPLAHRMVHTVLASLIHAFDWELEKGVKPQDLSMNYRFALAVHKTAPLRVVPVLRTD
uniref:Uncharacterized protein n=1 Tax=Kalanchoe fedtschenkoi TaxID=63787 RepID=A0A7N1A0J5_KALFE